MGTHVAIWPVVVCLAVSVALHARGSDACAKCSAGHGTALGAAHAQAPAEVPHKLFSQAAVLFTDRFGTEEELSTAVAYNATGLVWVYSTSASFVNTSHAMGFSVNLAINSEVRARRQPSCPLLARP